MSIFGELRRRNVFRATLAYGVFAWLLLQVVEFVLELVGSPDWVLRVLVVLAVAGLPAVAVFSWAFELTPEGIRREADVDRSRSIRPETGRRLNQITLVSVVVLVAFLLADRVYNTSTETPGAEAGRPGAGTTEMTAAEAVGTDTGTGEAEAAALAQNSLAVLPFANMSADPDNEYFSDGISEELLNLLAGVEGLRVPSRTSSFAFKGRNEDIRAIAAQLQVGHVLEGSVRKAGNQVRITAQLIDVRTDTHLWSDTWDRELEDIFAVQDEIAGQILESLKLTLALGEHQPPTTNLEAYTLYLQGRELMRRRGTEALLEAERLLGEATERDPEFADAWAIRSMVQVLLPAYIKDDFANFVTASRRYAERALELDPDNPEALLALAQIANVSGDKAGSLRRFETLVALHPRHSTARLWFAISLFQAGYLAEAYEQIDTGLQLDPAHATILDWHARIAYPAGHPGDVVAVAERALRLGRPLGRVALHQYFFGAGDVDDMEPYLQGENETPWGWMRQVYAVRDGRMSLADALAFADEAERNGAGFNAEYMRLNYLMAGDDPAAFFAQLRRMDRVDDTVHTGVWMPGIPHHRAAPAMRAWARELGFLALWQERGWPDLCRPLGDGSEDFECD